MEKKGCSKTRFGGRCYVYMIGELLNACACPFPFIVCRLSHYVIARYKDTCLFTSVYYFIHYSLIRAADK